MDVEEIDFIEKSTKIIENKINEQIKKYKNYPRILLLGLTGSGKSSVAGCLTRQNIKIEIIEKGIVLTGGGIVTGSTSGTEYPIIYVDEDNRLLICDCPGFVDTRGTEYEIINAFSDDYLLISENNDIKVKILLVVSESEFSTGRGKVVLDTFQRLKKMFPNPEQIRDSIGFIITKGNEDMIGTDYFVKLKEKANKELKEWCDYFMTRKKQVFLFPKASKENVGKLYHFDDMKNVIDFISCDFIQNPDHEITLSESAASSLRTIRSKHLICIDQIIQELFFKINQKYRENNDQETISKWLKIMHSLMDIKITKIKDFKEIISQYVDCEDYEDIFIKLEKYEAIDSFIDRFYDVDTITTTLQDTFRSLTTSALEELKKYQIYAENAMIQEKTIEEKKEMIQRYKNDLENQNNKINQMKLDFEEEQKKYSENERKNNAKLNQMSNELLHQQQIYQDKQREYHEQINIMNQKIKEQQIIMDEQKREHKEKLEQVYEDLRNQKLISDEMKKELSNKIDQIEQMKQEFFDKSNIQASIINESRESIEKLTRKIEDQDDLIQNLYNRPPVIVEKDGGCILI